MPGVWDEENCFDLADYANLDMEGCIRAMQENGMSSSSSSAGSHFADVGEGDRMDEDPSSLQVALPALPTRSEHLEATSRPVPPTGEAGEEISTPQSENLYTLDEIMAERYSPTASGYSRGEPTPGNGVDETSTGRRPSGDDKTPNTIGYTSNQAESTKKASGSAHLRPFSIVEASSGGVEKLSVSYNGSSSEDHCWRHEVNAIGDANQDALYGPAHPIPPSHIDGDDTGRQAPTPRGDGANRRQSVNSPGVAPPRVTDRTEQIRGSAEGSGLRTPTTSLNPPRPSVTVQNLRRVQDMLNNSAPVLAETPGFVQLVGQVSEIL